MDTLLASETSDEPRLRKNTTKDDENVSSNISPSDEDEEKITREER